MGIKTFLSILIILLLGSVAYGNEQKQVLGPKPGPGRVFFYTAKKFGIPILKASIKIENGSSGEGKLLYQVHASVESLPLGFLFRMKNRFLSTMDAETCSPVQYVKEIDQEGFMIGRKNYLQTFTFDFPNKKVVAEKGKKIVNRDDRAHQRPQGPIVAQAVKQIETMPTRQEWQKQVLVR